MESPAVRALRTALLKARAEPADLARYRRTINGVSAATMAELGPAVTDWVNSAPDVDPEADLKRLREAVVDPPAGEYPWFPAPPSLVDEALRDIVTRSKR